MLSLPYATKRSMMDFLKHRKVRLRSFSVLWDKNIPTENSGNPFFCIKTFETRNFLDNCIVQLQSFLFQPSETKLLSTKPWWPPHSHLQKNCSKPDFYLKHRRVPVRKFSRLWEGIFSMKNKYIPCLWINLFDTLDFLKKRNFPPRTFWHCETKFFRRKTVITFRPCLYLWCIIFSVPNIYWNTETTNDVFRSCEAIFLRAKSFIQFLMHIIFR